MFEVTEKASKMIKQFLQNKGDKEERKAIRIMLYQGG